jgi:hypothetical protein
MKGTCKRGLRWVANRRFKNKIKTPCHVGLRKIIKRKKKVHSLEGSFIVHPMDDFKNREMGLVCSWVLGHFD